MQSSKEVIKSLTAQLKDMAERLPVGSAPARAVKSPPSLNSFGSSPGRIDPFNILNRPNSQESEPNGLNTPMFSNGTITPVFGNGEATNEAQNEKEWVEQDEPGVYITLTALAGGARDLKRVRFSRKKFSEKQAEQWWADNRGRVYEQYNVRIVDKSSEEMPR
ncbi:hypothetical protein Bca52824_093367 [Brassica carinata]|uniref:BRX domain-containing protein n=1 Tax=Brassica carinata TaxID=52824 RepID=A0A8X7TKU1_BRACI|nr:hypothetical protein Bca52824_093367 [Brassica carinata]